MEDTLRVILIIIKMEKKEVVLILVLMEDTLREIIYYVYSNHFR